MFLGPVASVTSKIKIHYISEFWKLSQIYPWTNFDSISYFQLFLAQVNLKVYERTVDDLVGNAGLGI